MVQKNFQAVDETLAHLQEVPVPIAALSPALVSAVRHGFSRRSPVPLPCLYTTSACGREAPEFVRTVLGQMIAGEGDTFQSVRCPVMAPILPRRPVGRNATLPWTSPSGTRIICIQCGKCVMVCPHAVIRMKVYDPAQLHGAPETFLSTDARFQEFPGMKYTLQVSPRRLYRL